MFIRRNHLFIYTFLFFVFACTSSEQKKEKIEKQKTVSDSCYSNQRKSRSEIKSLTATHLDSLGLVNLADVDTSLVIQLIYSKADNFTGEILYKNLKEAYLHPDAAQALLLAHKKLKQRHPDYRFIIYDAARPMSVQQQMWNVVKNSSKSIYVSNPQHGGGLHNYGLAVDIGIIDSMGVPISMGTKVDHLGIEAHITNEQQLVDRKIISAKEHSNRVLLRQVMKEAGFRSLPTEWWHFNYCSRKEAFKKYKLIP